MKKIIVIVFFFILSINTVYADKKTVKLVNCIDGDTARFKLNKEEIKVRFLGIDTPETVKPNKKEEPYGKKASNYTCSKLKKANKIEIEYDEKSDKVDMYGRTLAYVFVDDKLIESLLLKKGYASVKYAKTSFKYYNELIEAEEYAKKKKVGIYSANEVVEAEELADSFIGVIKKYVDKLLAKILR